MPPRKRQNRPPDPDPARPSSPPPAREQSSQEDEDDDDDDDDAAGQPPLPFYNTTFSAHRVSPLYLGSEPLTTSRLQLLSQRLRDRLVGDVVRGVEVGRAAAEGGDDSSIVGRAGALEMVDIHWVGVADVLGISREDLESLGDDGDTANWHRAAAQLPDKKALHISLRYETASCTALMLPPLLGEGGERSDVGKTRFSVGGVGADEMDWERSVDPAHFLALPLLLLRMPAPLKTIIGEFLSTTFDCRASPMRLGTRTLVRSWEAWIGSAGLPSRGPLAKDVVLNLGFYVLQPDKPSPAPGQSLEDAAATADQQQPLGIKSIEIIIPAAELNKFVAAGKRLAKTLNNQTSASAGWGWEDDHKKRRKLAGRLYEEGWEWRRTSAADAGGVPDEQPFTEALACYLKEHAGLNLFHPGVRVVKIGCGGFAMSETRLKLFAPTGSGEPDGEGLSLLGQQGAVLELLGGLSVKAQVQTVAV